MVLLGTDKNTVLTLVRGLGTRTIKCRRSSKAKNNNTQKQKAVAVAKIVFIDYCELPTIKNNYLDIQTEHGTQDESQVQIWTKSVL